MFLVSNLYKTFIDALFPLSATEEELLSYTPEKALAELPPAPDFSGVAISKEETQNMKSVFGYKDERVAKLVWNIKYKKSAHAVSVGAYALLQELLRMSAERVPRDTPSSRARDAASSPSPSFGPKCLSESLSASMLILPTPITKRRRKERGYNQCELLTDEIGRLDIIKKFLFEKNLLIRVQHSDRQTLKDRKNRVEDAKGIFAVDKKALEKLLVQNSELKNSRVVIIDDVITTGSTLNEAMQTMKKAGFGNVAGLSLAH